MAKIVYAEDINYFKTSQKQADTWIDDAKKLIGSIGGKVLAEAYGSDAQGRSAFMIGFQIGTDTFKLTWPVLPCKQKANEKAAKVQAATLLYHDVKHKVVMAKIKGVRGAFLEYLMLPKIGRAHV